MLEQLRAIAVFQKVAETGSFRGAAKALGLSPSVVSHHVSSLEAYLGAALLYRTTRKSSLTEAGERLLEAASAMTAAAETGLAQARADADRPTGRLRVAAAGAVFESPPNFAHLAAFAKEHPLVDLSVSFSDQKIDLLGSAFDVALRVGKVDDSQYKQRKLATLSRVFVAAPDYVALRPLPQTIDDLESWDWIKLAQFPIGRQLAGIEGPAVGDFAPPIALEVDTVAALAAGARAGLGVAAVPRTVVSADLRAGRLIALSPDWELAPVNLYAVWPDNVAEDGLPRRFVRFMAKRMA